MVGKRRRMDRIPWPEREEEEEPRSRNPRIKVMRMRIGEMVRRRNGM